MPDESPASGRTARRSSAIWAVLTITVLTFAYRWSAPVAEFSPIDDGMSLAVAAQVNDGHWTSILHRTAGRFIPAYWSTSAVTSALAGPDPVAFHWVNTTLLLVGLLATAAWVRRRSGSWMAGTAAALLVLASSSVGEHLATLGKNEVRAVFFLGLGLLLADLFSESKKSWVVWSAGPAALVATFLCGASKETGIVVAAVPISALAVRWLASRSSAEVGEWRARGLAALALGVGALVYVMVRALVPGTESPYTTVAFSWSTVETGLRYYSHQAPDLWLYMLAAAILWGVCVIYRRGVSPILADAAGCLATGVLYLAVLLWWHLQQRYYLLLPVLFVACAVALAARDARSLPADRPGRATARRVALGSASLLVGAAMLFGVPVSWAVLQAQTRHDAAWADALRAFVESPGHRLLIETESWYSEPVSGSGLLLQHAYGTGEREVVGTRDLLNPALLLHDELRLHGVEAVTLADAARAPAAGDHLLVLAETVPAFALRGVGTPAPSVETRWSHLGARIERVAEDQRSFRYRLAPKFAEHTYRMAWSLYRVETPPWVTPAPPGSWREDGWVGSVLTLRALRPLAGELCLEGRSHPSRGVRLRVRAPEHVWEHEVAAGETFRAPLSGTAGLTEGDEVTIEAEADVADDDPDPTIRWMLDRLEHDPADPVPLKT